MIKKSEVTGFLSFFKFPKPFIYDEKYKTLSNNAKMLYMLLFDRLELSLKNGWHDKEGNVFQYYTNEQLMIDLNCNSNKTIIKIKKELKDAGLMTEVRQGMNLPNRIYLDALNGSVESTFQEVQKVHLGSVENTLSEVQKVHTIKTENTKTENNNNKLLICKEVISYLNLKAKKNFKVDTASHQKFIKARLKEGYVLEDFKKVVDIMVAKWKSTEYEQYLQPQTLFGNKMDNYLNQPMPQKVRSFQSAVDERLGF
ncbi:TPA: conserved phage C-terminal domain-containing protein [Streptococcus pneumoniae]|uniref:conserved phage C-terminal domain-containing protein n=1 Tax=Streptococcus pneumoniae TaxID=1313 RepID=UPI0007652F15|nr:conserved phage C-terminal domain-containing protein [Streptococcus pneumoniae]EJC7687825.1 conserved phage C-terminal domain-containing protein [Listeria monocytogenes]MDV8269550.1 conserved phage C-terminal domain-containing protein [Streptococcus pneumoniae]MDV8514882.1 conserved phage C-terminal domain-containing protein [Streptococcus pneumoniae]MDV8522967.1 conserved phage C-terminal domain-containing protein [Streptococcus pneumoniae]MDV8624277.1 conserved phage C-terminal domain-con